MRRPQNAQLGVEEFRPSPVGVRLLAGLLIIGGVASALVALALVRGLALVCVLVAIVACTAVLIRLLKLAFAAPIVSLDNIGIVVRGLGFVPWRDLDRVIIEPSQHGGSGGRWVGLVLHDTTTFTESRRAALAQLPMLARWIASASRGSHRLNRRMFGAHVFIPVGAGGARTIAAAIEARRPGG